MHLPRRAKLPNPETFNVNEIDDNIDIENEIGQLVKYRKPLDAYAEAAPSQPPPPTVEALTAQAVMVPYEQFAKDIEANIPVMRELAQAHEKALADIAACTADIADTAKRYREMGEAKRALIEKTSADIAEVTALCSAVRSKIGPTT